MPAGASSPSAAASSIRGEPKYLNSPETVLFHKGRELYGLYETRRARTNLTRLLVVEGYMDAVRLHQSGIDYAVATLGTATTAEHLKRLFRLVSEVVFAFDGDRAGRAAAWRALQQALPEAREGRELRFLFLPEGHDPDTPRRRGRPRGLRGAPVARRCRSRNTWCANLRARRTSPTPTAARALPRARGRCS